MMDALKHFISSRHFHVAMFMLMTCVPALAYATNYSFSGAVGGANFPTCSSGSWSSSGTTYTCSGSITLASGDTITPTASITVVANAGITLNGSNTIGTATYTVNLQTTYGNIAINNTGTNTTTVYGSLTTSSGSISTTNAIISGNVAGGGAVSLNAGSVGGNVSSTNGSVTTTNGTTIGGNVAANNGSISLSGGTVTGAVHSNCCGVTTNNTNINGGVSSNSNSVSITGGTINGAISGNGVSITNATVASGSISSNNAITISGSTIGSPSSPVNITGSNTVTINNGSTVYGNVTSGNWSGALSVSGNSAVTGTCTPSNASCNSSASPSLSVIKLVQVLSDPVSGTTLPKAIPGAVLQYTIKVTNSGLGTVDNNTFVLTDAALPSQVALCVSTMCAPSGPFVFTDSSPASGLGCSTATSFFVSLSSNTDCVDFTSDGTTWTYTPTADANGYDANVKGVRFKPTGQMNAAGGSNPSATFVFLAKIK